MTQLEHLDKVSDDMAVVREFLEWILTQGIIMDSTQHVLGTFLDATKFVDRFFDIDPAKIEAERKDLLKEARAKGLV